MFPAQTLNQNSGKIKNSIIPHGADHYAFLAAQVEARAPLRPALAPGLFAMTPLVRAER